MKVLHINQSDISGGAAIAAYRLHQGLMQQGIESKLLVSHSQIRSDRIALIPQKHMIAKLLGCISQPLGLNYVNYLGAFNISEHPFYQDATVLNFHNLHTGWFNYLALPKLSHHKPVLFTLHDMWSFTGHCAYSSDCNRWMTGCGRCPYPDSYPRIRRDNTRLEWRLKQWVYSKTDLTVVVPSRWLMEMVQKSLLNCFPIHHIPYGIDTETFQRLDPEQCRSLLGIAPDSKVLMFGAQNLSDPRKGGDLLLTALEQLPKSLKAETLLLTIGTGPQIGLSEMSGIKVLNLGYVTSDRLKAIAYSTADLFVLPTRADNLPLMLQESMACGTPMVSFKVGGISELVQPDITGYLAEPENAADLSQGIVQLLSDPDGRERMGQTCRNLALREYPLHLQAIRYRELYQQMIKPSEGVSEL